jgi:hypothetical protein
MKVILIFEFLTFAFAWWLGGAFGFIRELTTSPALIVAPWRGRRERAQSEGAQPMMRLLITIALCLIALDVLVVLLLDRAARLRARPRRITHVDDYGTWRTIR